MIETYNFNVLFAGESNDGRANKWQVKCSCSKKYFYPLTTRLSHQEVVCPKCGKSELIDWNKVLDEMDGKLKYKEI